jgi:hypothetical protein
VAKKDVNQDLFITAEKSIITYGEIFEAHSSVCRGKLKTTKRTMKVKDQDLLSKGPTGGIVCNHKKIIKIA